MITTYKDEPEKSIKTRFSQSGVKQEETVFYGNKINIHAPYNILNRRVRTWYASGQIKRQMYFKEGMRNGQLIAYGQNGVIRRNEYYSHDSVVIGKCYDSLGREVPYFPREVMAIFPGGEVALKNFIATHIQFPLLSRKAGIEGTVNAQFTIMEDSTVSDIKILKTPANDMAAEVIRVIRFMPRWIPGKNEGVVVPMYYVLPVVFSLH